MCSALGLLGDNLVDPSISFFRSLTLSVSLLISSADGMGPRMSSGSPTAFLMLSVSETSLSGTLLADPMYSETPSTSFVSSMGKKNLDDSPFPTSCRVCMDRTDMALESMDAAPTDIILSFWASPCPWRMVAILSPSASRIMDCLLPSASRIIDFFFPSASRMAALFWPSASRMAARLFLSADVCSSMESLTLRAGSTSLISTASIFTPHLSVFSSRMSLRLTLILSLEDRIWSSSISPIMDLRVVWARLTVAQR